MRDDVLSDCRSYSGRSFSCPSNLPIPTYRFRQDKTVTLPSSSRWILGKSISFHLENHMALRVSYPLELCFSFLSHGPVAYNKRINPWSGSRTGMFRLEIVPNVCACHWSLFCLSLNPGQGFAFWVKIECRIPTATFRHEFIIYICLRHVFQFTSR
jgi:hypothetical protein